MYLSTSLTLHVAGSWGCSRPAQMSDKSQLERHNLMSSTNNPAERGVEFPPEDPALGDSRSNPAPLGRILVVDDLADNRAILLRRFQRQGFEVVEADSGI